MLNGTIYTPVCLLSPPVFVKDLANISTGSNRTCIILYANDILLIAPTITSLQNLLHACEVELNWLDMSINVKKSNCIRIGPRIDAM